MMRLTIRHGAKRPSHFSWPFILLGLAGLALCLGSAAWLAQSQFGHMVLLFVKLVFHLVPPLVWLGGSGVVALWLFVLNYLWRGNGRKLH